MTYHGRAVESPAVVARVAQILRTQWDLDAVLLKASGASDAFYDEQAIIVTGMLSAGARDLDVQRYLQQFEQRTLPQTLHPADERHAIAAALWQAVRVGEN